MLRMPMAASVPSTVATTDEITATSRVFMSDWMIIWLWKSFSYQAKVKPVHAPRDLDWLKEKTMSTRIGA